MTALSPSKSTATPPHVSGSRRFVIDVPRDTDYSQLQRLYAQSMPGPISLSLRAEPDYRQALKLQGDRHDTVVVRQRDDGKVVAMGSRSVRPLWINGEVQRVGYLSSLRNSPGVRLPRRLVAEAFGWLLDQRRADEAGFDLTSILADNHPARRSLERGVKGMPHYTAIGSLDTLALRTRKPRDLAKPLRRLSKQDGSALQTLLETHGRMAFARPSWDLSLSTPPAPDAFLGYGSPADLIGAAALWDQRAIKQTVVDDLSAGWKRWRRMINIGCRLLGCVELPRPGEILSAVYASHLAYPEGRSDVLRVLLQALRTEAASQGAKTLVVGLTPTQTKEIGLTMRRQAWKTSSVIYAVHRGAPPELDGRPVWPEVALL